MTRATASGTTIDSVAGFNARETVDTWTPASSATCFMVTVRRLLPDCDNLAFTVCPFFHFTKVARKRPQFLFSSNRLYNNRLHSWPVDHLPLPSKSPLSSYKLVKIHLTSRMYSAIDCMK